MITALILSVDHRIYQGQVHEAMDLHDLTTRLQSLGLDVSSPVGVQPPDFVLLLKGSVPNETDGSDYRNPEWISPKQFFPTNPKAYDIYCDLMLGGYRPPKDQFDVFYFGSGGFMASQLAHLVAKGQKRLTAGWIASHIKSGTSLSEVGCVSLVTDSFGIPIACIETIATEVVRFCDVTEEMARLEGEGDLTLADWKRGRWDFWTNVDAKQTGIPFTETDEIFTERFKVLHTFTNQKATDRPTVTMLVGSTGAGKTTLGRKLAKQQRLTLFAIDEWMKNLFAVDAPTQQDLNWALDRCARCETQIERQLEAEIHLGRGAILDLGFSKRVDRDRWQTKIENLGGTPKLIYLDVPRNVRWERVLKRNLNLKVETQAVAVDKGTFDWMESYFEPPANEENCSTIR